MELFFGGSFDPPHLGHLIVSRDVAEVMGFEKVVFVPTFQAPLKEPHQASPKDRLKMLELSIQGLDNCEVSDIEIKRGGISYTVDTAEELSKSLSEKPFFLVGADSFLNLHLWKEPQRLVELARFVIVDREGKSQRIELYLKEHFPHLKKDRDFFLLEVRRIDLSSTEIRERVKKGKSIRWMVTERVEDYIMQNDLYL